MVSAALFTSDKQDWGTPRWLFEACNRVYRFQLDAAASAENALCPFYYTEEQDGLVEPWADSTWTNPPYLRGVINAFVAKASSEWNVWGHRSVMLLPARTCNAWFHTYIYQKPHVAIRFIRGRLKFEGAPTGAPFPSMLVSFGFGPGMLNEVQIPWPR